MEIESKFLVLDEADIQNLETLSQLGDYSLSEGAVQVIEDIFLDTTKMVLMSEGYFLRLRKETGKIGQWLTIKSLGGFEAGVHRREEYVSFLPEEVSVLECPDIKIRNRILELSSCFDLIPVMKLKQKRLVRQVKLGETQVAEFSLDRVSLKSETKEKLYSELEIELKAEGTLQDLQAITEYLLENYNLGENPFSKFERAIFFKNNLPEKTLLNFRERAFCMQLEDQENVYGKQARILLSLDKGLNTSELSLLLKVPESEIEALRSGFEKERLVVFPFSSEINASGEFHFQAGHCASGKNRANTSFEKWWTLETLFELYGVNKTRAEKIRDNTLILFDGLFPYHRLGKEEREMLSFAALLQDIGTSVSPEDKFKMGREILLTHPLKGLKLHELRMLALIMELQSPVISVKNLSSAFEESHIALPPEIKNKALILASFIRIADLLKKGDLKFLPGRIRQIEGAVEVEIFGQAAEKAVKRAEKRSELWEYLFGTKLLFTPGKETNEAEIINKEVEESGEAKEKEESKKENRGLKLAVRPENSMAMVAQKVFSRQFARMLAHEKGTRKGEDIEELHDMRVSIRRMRAAAKVFEAYLDSKKLGPHLKGLKSTLGALGDVRDLDVFREKAEEYLKKLPPENEHDLDPLFAVLAEEREKSRKNMLIYLESERYSNFKKEFSEDLADYEFWALPTTTKKHDALPHRIKDVLPSILYARFADIGAYSEWVEGPYVYVERLHRLRIAAKGLRYTLEFFGEVLGKDVEIMIEEFKALQDHLGDLHDAVVAIDLLDNYLQTGEWGLLGGRKNFGEKRIPEGLKGVEAYRVYREEELQTLLDTFPEAWAKVQSEEFRQRIGNAVNNLYKAATSS